LECEKSSGNCLSVNVSGILMLVAAVLVLVLLALLAARCVNRRREKRVELVSELL
jgi:hypothetical protein